MILSVYGYLTHTVLQKWIIIIDQKNFGQGITF